MLRFVELMPRLFEYEELFVPADNKLEAVIRISQLTHSGPQELGPGSKERKSVLINLAQGFALNVNEQLSKPELGEQIALAFGTTWDSSCWSTGHTITLVGLNRLLEAGWRRTNKQGPLERPRGFDDEVARIAEVVTGATPRAMEGRTCIEAMREAGSTNWRQTEWPGWYFEFVARNALISSLGGGPVRIGRTEFDYALNRVWDLKAHSSRTQDKKTGKMSRENFVCPLNDKESMERAIGERGLGLVILSGGPSYDIDFQIWHMELRGKTTPVRRLIKSEFKPERLEMFLIPNIGVLEQAVSVGQLTVFNQGHQPSGQPRLPKFSTDLRKCRGSDLQVYSHTF